MFGVGSTDDHLLTMLEAGLNTGWVELVIRRSQRGHNASAGRLSAIARSIEKVILAGLVQEDGSVVVAISSFLIPLDSVNSESLVDGVVLKVFTEDGREDLKTRGILSLFKEVAVDFTAPLLGGTADGVGLGSGHSNKSKEKEKGNGREGRHDLGWEVDKKSVNK